MNRDADDLISNRFVFARMQTRPDFQPESADGLTDCSRASNRLGWRLERGEHSVTGSDYLQK